VIVFDTLVGELLASARLDFAALSPRPLDGAEAARRALERAGLPAGLLVVAPESEGALGFEADATLVARALANLLDNARRHGGVHSLGPMAGTGVHRLAVSAAAFGRPRQRQSQLGSHGA